MATTTTTLKKPTQDLTQQLTSTTSYKTTAGNANSNHSASVSNQGSAILGNTGVSNYTTAGNNNSAANAAKPAATGINSIYGSAANAQAYLQGQQAPAAYQSQYQPQLTELYNQITNREPFSYDLNGDMLYQNYKDQYMQAGRQAMMDTMGQAAALTGGYGSSYASTAGNQAYQQYLTQLNNMIPQLYDRAYGRYQDEGQDLYNRMNMTQGLENTDYGRWNDSYNRYLSDRDFALNYENMMYGREQADKQQAYNMAMQMAQMGQTPSADLLARAGLTKAEWKKLTQPKASGSKGGSPGKTGDPIWKQYGFNSEAEYLEWLKKYGSQDTEDSPKTKLPRGSGSTGTGSTPGRSQIDQIIF